MNLRELLNIDFDNFHFLRPQWLWLTAPVLVVLIILVFGIREKRKWRNVVAPPLRPFMFSKGNRWSFLLPIILYFIGLLCIVVALAGPTWKKIQIPGARIEAVVLIALDLSQSMMATDLQPTRLDRGRFKIIDFLDANPRARAGLLAVAGTTHPVLPVTSDYNIIKHHAASLESWIMPVRGRNLSITMSVVDSLMSKVEAPSTLLLVTDEIAADEIPLLTNFLNNTPHHIEILLTATPQGAPVPGFARGVVLKHDDGSQVVSRPDPNVMEALRNEPKIKMNLLTLDKSDVEGIAQRIRENLTYQEEDKESEKDWQDMGLLFLIPALVIALFWFRKGWTIQWCLIPGIALSFLSCTVDSRHADWWYTKDFQGQQLSNEGRFAEAADRFEDIPHKAVAAYKAGDFETAAELFALDSSATGKYNRGLALVKLGRYDEAAELFNEAIAANPALAQARESLDKTKQIISQIDSVTRFGDKSESPDTKAKDPLKERKAQSEDEQLTSDTEVKELPKTGDRVTDEVATNIRRARESDTPDTTMTKPDDDAQRILLQKISASPSDFLRRRFLLQKNRYYKDIKEGDKKW